MTCFSVFIYFFLVSKCRHCNSFDEGEWGLRNFYNPASQEAMG